MEEGVFITPGDLSDEQSRFLLAQFLFTRILCRELVLKPWTCGVGPAIPPGKNELGNLKLMTFLLYRALCQSLGGEGEFASVEEASVRGEIGKLPGDEAYLVEHTKSLVEELRGKFAEMTMRLFGQLTAKRPVYSVTPVPGQAPLTIDVDVPKSVAGTAANSPVKAPPTHRTVAAGSQQAAPAVKEERVTAQGKDAVAASPAAVKATPLAAASPRKDGAKTTASAGASPVKEGGGASRPATGASQAKPPGGALRMLLSGRVERSLTCTPSAAAAAETPRRDASGANDETRASPGTKKAESSAKEAPPKAADKLGARLASVRE